MAKILYVEDELSLAYIVRDTLVSKGYEVKLVSDGAEAVAAFQNFQPDICLLDVMLPNVDGFAIGQELRSLQSDFPILYLTAKNEQVDVIKGFRSGGNDYLKKPFNLEELLVRIDNLLAIFSRKGEETIIQIGKYTFEPNKLELGINGQSRKLTYRETQVLQTLWERRKEVINRKQLLLDIWADDSISNSRILDVYITKLRDYLSKDSSIEIITLRAVGYMFRVG